MCCKKLLELHLKKKFVFHVQQFSCNVCDQGKTLCSPCSFQSTIHSTSGPRVENVVLKGYPFKALIEERG